MGAAIAWAATQSALTVLAVFAAVGIGMALPYLVLAAFPQLTARIPKTGPASELIKQVMALLLLAAAAFFVGAGLSGLLVNPPDPPSKLYWWAVALFTVIAGAWLAVRTLQITRRPGMRATFGLVGVLMGAIGALIGFSQTAKGPINWTYYTPERLAAAIGQGDVVVIDFTAEWCLTCKTLESTVLNLPSISKELNGKGVAPIKVDITGNNEAGNELLKKYGRITIPLLVVLDEKGNEVFLSDTYGPQQVLDALQKARGASAAAGALGGS
jgi:thiol:disulfide interchange protein DsbD